VNDSRSAKVWAWIAEYAASHRTAVSLPSACDACPGRVGVTGVGVTIWTGPTTSEPVYATDLVARRLQDLQFTLGEGPCVTALRFGVPVFVPELASRRSQHSWPLFAPDAVREGALAMAAIPMVAGAVRVGLFATYRAMPGPLSATELTDVLLFADIAMQLLLDAWAGAPGDTGRLLKDGQPLGRLHVHQATGMISVQLGVGIDAALLRLRAYAFVHHRPVTEVARDVVAHRLRFGPDLP
jgi:hypothetical protein